MFHFTADEAWAPLEGVRGALVGLRPRRLCRRSAARSAGRRQAGVKARLYDRLIGEAAGACGAPAIVTWNSGHMRNLFPELRLVTPIAFTGPLISQTRAGGPADDQKYAP